MRKEGASLREIAFQLGVSISSASLWVRDIRQLHSPEEQTPPKETAPSAAEETSEPDRPCGSCKRVLPAIAFNKHPSGRQWKCRECFRTYFEERGDLHRQQSAAARKARQKAAFRYTANYKSRHPCVDCDLADVVVLEFDHLEEKRGDISVLAAAGLSLDALGREIEKCDVVCVNCHRRRTGERGSWRRAHKPWWRSPPPKRYETARNLAYAYSYLERTGCLDCGESDICVLDFDHQVEKMGLVTVLAREGVGLRRLKDEMSRCDVRCANCHRHRTFRQQQRSPRRG